MVLIGVRPVYVPALVGCACSRTTYYPTPEVEDEARRIAGLPPIDRSMVIGIGEDPNASSVATLATAGIIGAALLMFLFSGAF